VFHEDGERGFSLTPMGNCLRSDAPIPVGPWAAFVGRPYVWQAWAGLIHSVQTGGNAFRHVHGTDVWAYRAGHPEEGSIFDRAMTGMSQSAAQAVAKSYDFTAFDCVVDVGGGHGALLVAILASYPKLRGILFDQPHVASPAGAALQRAGVSDRCRIVTGSFFDSLPEGGDAHVLKAILHDWDDDNAVSILRVCRRTIRPRGKLLVVERLIAPPNEGPEAKLSDLNMLVSPGGRERTREEFAQLFEASGFRLASVTPTGTRLNVIEGLPI
jgi:SAM-dependent methyltransferase